MALSEEDRQAGTTLRDVGTPLQWLWLVDPNGFPKRVAVAANINNGHTFVDDSGHTRLLGVLEEAGWKLMRKAVTAEEWAVWTDYQAKSEARRGRMKPLPDHLWPKGIKRPHERNAVDGKADYEPAAPAPTPAPVSAGKPADPGATTRSSTHRG